MDRLQEICDELLQRSNSRAVMLLDADGHEVVHAGAGEVRLDAAQLVRWRERLHGERELSEALPGEARSVHVAAVAKGMLLAVVFDSRSSLGMVRLRSRRAVESLTKRLASAGGHVH